MESYHFKEENAPLFAAPLIPVNPELWNCNSSDIKKEKGWYPKVPFSTSCNQYSEYVAGKLLYEDRTIYLCGKRKWNKSNWTVLGKENQFLLANLRHDFVAFHTFCPFKMLKTPRLSIFSAFTVLKLLKTVCGPRHLENQIV